VVADARFTGAGSSSSPVKSAAAVAALAFLQVKVVARFVVSTRFCDDREWRKMVVARRGDVCAATVACEGRRSGAEVVAERSREEGNGVAMLLRWCCSDLFLAASGGVVDARVRCCHGEEGALLFVVRRRWRRFAVVRRGGVMVQIPASGRWKGLPWLKHEEEELAPWLLRDLWWPEKVMAAAAAMVGGRRGEN